MFNHHKSSFICLFSVFQNKFSGQNSYQFLFLSMVHTIYFDSVSGVAPKISLDDLQTLALVTRGILFRFASRKRLRTSKRNTAYPKPTSSRLTEQKIFSMFSSNNRKNVRSLDHKCPCLARREVSKFWSYTFLIGSRCKRIQYNHPRACQSWDRRGEQKQRRVDITKTHLCGHVPQTMLTFTPALVQYTATTERNKN